MLLKYIFAIVVLPFISEMAQAKDSSECNSGCTFVLFSENSGKYQFENEERANLRLPPFSTFKIANSMIALDIGVISGIEEKLTFDQKLYPIQNWWPDTWYMEPLNLRDAFAYSALPIYQSIAVQINDIRMKEYLHKFQYGNMDITSGIDTFWLGESLKITAKEQVDFIRKLYSQQLPLTKKTFSSMKEIMLSEKTEKYKIYSKTGAGHLSDHSFIGWYVGIVENNEGTHYFALSITGDSFTDVIRKRTEVARKLLRNAGVLKG